MLFISEDSVLHREGARTGFLVERVDLRGGPVTESFEISGPSAFVSISGEVSLPRETQALTLKVVPEVGEGMALAATVFGTPGDVTVVVRREVDRPAAPSSAPSGSTPTPSPRS